MSTTSYFNFLRQQPFYRTWFQWYPGHMRTSVHKMKQIMSRITIVLEIHDARVPLSCRNHSMVNEIVGDKQHLLILNKAERVSAKDRKKITDSLKIPNMLFSQLSGVKQGQRSSSLKLEDNVGLHDANRILSILQECSQSKYDNNTILVIGVPNVGKSTLINQLRSAALGLKRAVPIGSEPGVTRSLMTPVKICALPPIYVIDSPGVLEPHLTDIGVACKLTLVECMRTQQIVNTRTTIGQFLKLYMDEYNYNGLYRNLYDIKEKENSFIELLVKIAKKHSLVTRSGRKEFNYNLENACDKFIADFKSGKLGQIYLDNDVAVAV
ncbi:hypothetical protein GJ496_004123 [Pomphorhynchus laevis]|nr:hypothetical protein GJ496_004123 [Pomphorhynchus laevis]